MKQTANTRRTERLCADWIFPPYNGNISGNRLSSVSASTDALPFDGMTGVGLDKSNMAVTYDASGRMSSDARRGIVSVDYDNDGHPVRTVFKDGNEQRDVWDGLGNHLATHYYITDHQGNHTVVIDSTPKITEENNYYPYGEPWRENNGDPFMFSGNERLLIDGLNDYDFHARRYNAAVPAFSSWDALNEQYPWLSPYAYCAGNPINMTGPSGNRIVTWSNGIEWELRYEEEYNFYNTVNNSTEFWNDAFMVELIKGIDELSKGDVGKLLIDGLIHSQETITIQSVGINGKEGSSFNFNNNVLKWNYNDTKGGPTVNISITDYTPQERPGFVSLGHELAHAFDAIYGSIDKSTWFVSNDGKLITKSDIFAGNVENAIRVEHFLPLRKAYDHYQKGESIHRNGHYNLSPYMYSHTRNYIKSLIK